MTRFLQDTFHFDFGDNDHMSNIYWTATVTIDTKYDTVESYTIDGVHAYGKILKWENTPEELKEKIRDRMNNVETAEFLP